MSTTDTIRIDAIRTDGGTQPRGEMLLDVVLDYGADLERGVTFPPVVVFYDGTDHWLADGFHRLDAHRQIGRETIEAIVHQGTVRDAQLASFGANHAHGQRRSPGDKRRAVETMLRDPEWQTWSDRVIAERCKVSHTFVSKVRAETTGNVASSRKGRDGKTRRLPAATIPPPLPPQPPTAAEEEERSIVGLIDAVAMKAAATGEAPPVRGPRPPKWTPAQIQYLETAIERVASVVHWLDTQADSYARESDGVRGRGRRSCDRMERLSAISGSLRAEATAVRRAAQQLRGLLGFVSTDAYLVHHVCDRSWPPRRRVDELDAVLSGGCETDPEAS